MRKCLTKFSWIFERGAVQKFVNLVDLVKSFPAAGVGDAVSTQKQPKKGCGIKEANSAAQKRRLKVSVGSQGKPDAKKANAKVAPKKKSMPE